MEQRRGRPRRCREPRLLAKETCRPRRWGPARGTRPTPPIMTSPRHLRSSGLLNGGEREGRRTPPALGAAMRRSRAGAGSLPPSITPPSASAGSPRASSSSPAGADFGPVMRRWPARDARLGTRPLLGRAMAGGPGVFHLDSRDRSRDQPSMNIPYPETHSSQRERSKKNNLRSELLIIQPTQAHQYFRLSPPRLFMLDAQIWPSLSI
jgi:hypothetical protein